MILTRRHRFQVAALAVLAAALSWMVGLPAAGSTGHAGTPAIVDPALRAAHGTVGIVVAGGRAAESTVRDMGGRITHDLPIINGFSAKVSVGDVPRIAQLPGVRSVTLDRSTHVQAASLGESALGATNNIPSVFKKVVRGDSLNGLGAKGQGVTVALIDTGVTALPDLSRALLPVALDPLGVTTASCVNFTDEPTCNDSYGHGTFMAGLIVGDGTASGGKYIGMAPRANLISIKIAGATGASDVSTIIAAIQWVVSFQAQYNIRVLNLSLGTDSTQSYTVDPLDYAVERAWQRGIVVTVAASNRGPAAHTISDPANDPFVITVGATDDKGTTSLTDDVLPNFSGRGPTATDELSKPDLTAPGAHLVSLAAPGAAITTQFPTTMPAPYRRGSGTSMANAVVAGLIADVLSAQPTATPDRVKYELMSTAHQTRASHDPLAVGAGVPDGMAALSAPVGLANVGVAPSTGTGSLAASRGTVGIVLDDANQTVLDASSGNLTSQLTTWDPAELLTDPWTGNSWWGNSWWGNSWWGNSWWGNSWWGNSWWGNSWWEATNADGSTSTEDYGNSWWGGAWYGAWDQ